MSKEIVSRRLRNMLADYLSANSVLREIENEFEAEGVVSRPSSDPSIGGQRRGLVHDYYRGMDFTNPRDARQFMNVLSVFMREMERSGTTVNRESDLARFRDQLRRDGHEYVDGSIVSTAAASQLVDARAIASRLDASHISDQIRRIEASVDSDPALAIGSAKELCESCFKTILSERRVAYTKREDLPALGRLVFKALKLLPDDVPEAARGAEAIRRLLSNLLSVVQGLAEIRSLYGTGHGREGKTRGVQPRHAKLAVGAAATLVTFLFHTHAEGRAS